MRETSMNFQSRATLGALLALVFTSGAAMQAQMVVPVQDVNVSSLRERAAAGDAQAQFDLGNYYFRGRYLTLEHANALTWYRKSADQGYAPAENQLGTMYQH